MFPNPPKLPESVAEARKERRAQLIRSAWSGIFLRGLIVIVELLVVLLFGSAALLLDALHSLTDIASSLLIIISIFIAEKPPDQNHPFGHGRYEPLMATILSVVFVMLGAAMFVVEIFAIYEPVEQQPIEPWLWVIPLGGIALLECAYRLVIRVAKKMDSPALELDAVHYRIDALTTFIALMALALAAFNPHLSYLFDRCGAAAIAIVMMILGIWAARNNVQQLTDRVPSPDYFLSVQTAAMSVSGVLGTEKLRIQAYGPDAQVSIDIEVDPNLSVQQAHTISQKVRIAIQKKWPAVRDVIVHIEPYYPNDH